MMKSKRGTALFDLLGSTKPSAGDTPREAPDPIVDRPAPPKPIPTRRAPNAAIHGAQAEPETRVEVDGGRLRVSFTTVGAAATVFALVLSLIGSFELGRRRGNAVGLARGYQAGRESIAAEADSEIEAARRQAPATHLVRGLLDVSDASVPGPVGPTESSTGEVGGPAGRWVPGLTYVVVQEFAPANADDARHARAYLADNGVDVAVIERLNGWTQLVTEQGYDRGDPAQRDLADRLLRRVHAIGAKYYAAGGGYKMEGYFKTHKTDGW
jgi:hypothetical protein